MPVALRLVAQRGGDQRHRDPLWRYVEGETRPSHGPTYLPPYPTLASTHIHVCGYTNAHHNYTHTGAYLMVVKALGLGPGASVGFFYWLGMTALMAVEIYGFAEGAELLV